MEKAAMDNRDKEYIDKIIEDRKRAHWFYTKKSDVYRAFSTVEEKAFADGSLPKVHKELIAAGISVVTDCDSCMEWHIHEALKAGATPEQVIEAVGVAIEMGAGKATVSARFAMKVLEYYQVETRP
jgi:AhpD family alkylhydroperoxidase